MKKEDFIYLIYKEYRGMITAEEQDNLEYWLSASAENKKIKDDILLSMNMLDDYKPSFEVDLDEDFSALQSKINDGEKKMTTPIVKKQETKVFIMKTWMYAAASLVLVLGTLAVFQFGGSASDEMLMAMTNEGEKKEILLADGSTVWLNENSSLSYPSKFAKDKRSISLKGEAYFEVARDPSKRFEIKTGESMTTVLGTSFNIKEDISSTYITVRTGKVKFEDLDTEEETILVAKDAAELKHEQNKITTTKVSTMNAMAWQTGKLSFKDAPLKDVIGFLSEFFDVDIDIENADIEDCTIDMTKQPADLKIIFNNIKKINKVEVKEKGDKKYVLSGGKCPKK